MASSTEINRLAEAFFFLAAGAKQIQKVVKCWDIPSQKAFQHELEDLQS